MSSSDDRIKSISLGLFHRLVAQNLSKVWYNSQAKKMRPVRKSHLCCRNVSNEQEQWDRISPRSGLEGYSGPLDSRGDE